VPWVSIEDSVVPLAESLVGARPGCGEVAVMGSLTANLHLLMVAMYTPTPTPAATAPAPHATTPPAAPATSADTAAACSPAARAPRGGRYKILTEAHAFPSDTYAVASQLAVHGIDRADGLVEVAPREGEGGAGAA
jgi:kynureninase